MKKRDAAQTFERPLRRSQNKQKLAHSEEDAENLQQIELELDRLALKCPPLDCATVLADLRS
jgi:hypothetical protein